jgi:peptide/nickel transport system ATP-binding protein
MSGSISALLGISDLHLVIGDRPILRGVSISVAPGKVVGLVGESGAGKTMLGRVVLGIQPQNSRITGGKVVFDHNDITHQSERQRAHLLGREIALVPQNPMTALNPVARIEPQITDVLCMHMGHDRRAARARALELLHSVHLREPERLLRRYPHELSGGMRQRVLIAIAFACKPRLIIADEPTTALDVTVQRQILRLLRELQQTSGTAVLFITHDLGVVSKICDEVHVMHGGRILESAPVAQLFEHPEHPYTRALMAATPRYDRPGEMLQPIPIEVTAQLQREALQYDVQRAGAHAAA